MFEVITESPLDEVWGARDRMMVAAAGRQSDGAACSVVNGVKRRHHTWKFEDFDAALSVRRRLAKIPKVRATMREEVTQRKRH